MNVKKDRYGIKLKYPDRSCKNCKKYPCFNGMDNCSCDFAIYGCIEYDGISSVSGNK